MAVRCIVNLAKVNVKCLAKASIVGIAIVKRPHFRYIQK